MNGPKILLLFLVFSGSLFCQQNETTTLRFNEETYDFGNLKIDSKTTHDFYFTNTGKHPLILKQVTASCGCTTPHWDSLPIAPGKHGKITVVFSCFPLEKAFNKTISVESNAIPNRNLLEIKGTCVDIFKSQKLKYTMQIGRLFFENTHLDFDKIYSNVTLAQKLIYFYNNSDDTIFVLGFNTPKHILCASSPDIILPHEEGSVIVNYNANLNLNLGYNFDKIKMITSDKDYPEKLLAISSNVLEYFDTLLNNNAVLYLKEKFFEFGKIKTGEIKTHNFEMTNKGSDTLFIRKIRASCGCTEWLLTNDKIAPGKTSVLKIKYNTAGAVKGINNKPITIISTDRKNPEVDIGVSVIVE